MKYVVHVFFFCLKMNQGLLLLFLLITKKKIMAFCSKCGTEFNDGAQFCPKCGQPTNAASQQQVYQQQYVAQPQEKEHSRMYKMWHSKWNWIAAIVFLIIIVAANMGGGSDTDMLQKEVKKMMVEKMKEKGQSLVITDFTLVHQDGNNYTGLAACTLDGEKMDLDVKVVYDGSSFQAEWAPTAEYQQKALEEGLQELFNN